jgi:hypothetical protein
MNIDFHYGIIYVVSRLAGLNPGEAEVVAHACQYIDDSTTPGVLRFRDGQTFDRFAAAHEWYDYWNFFDKDNREVWAPFHFLPGNQGETFDERVVCRKDSEVAREMARRFLAADRNDDNALHGLGVLLHTYVDTWAHQGFSGMNSPHNAVHHFESENYTAAELIDKVKGFVETAKGQLEGDVIDLGIKVGHGAAIHFPDLPWFKWRYRNGFNQEIERDNLPDFVDAAKMAHRVVGAFIERNDDFQAARELSPERAAQIQQTLEADRSEDSNERLAAVGRNLCNGAIPEIPEELPTYVPKGPGSWKHSATGLTTVADGDEPPIWSEAFEQSDYRKFHDAVKQHRADVTQFLLPSFGIRLA